MHSLPDAVGGVQLHILLLGFRLVQRLLQALKTAFGLGVGELEIGQVFLQIHNGNVDRLAHIGAGGVGGFPQAAPLVVGAADGTDFLLYGDRLGIIPLVLGREDKNAVHIALSANPVKTQADPAGILEMDRAPHDLQTAVCHFCTSCLC